MYQYKRRYHILFNAIAIILSCLFIATDIAFGLSVVSTQSDRSVLAPPLATKPPCEIVRNPDGSFDVVTYDEILKDRIPGHAFRNRWVFVDVGFLIAQMLKLTREHKLKNPIDILIPLIKKHIRNIDGEAETLLEGYNIDGISEIREGEDIKGFILPVNRNGKPTYQLVYNFEGGDMNIALPDGTKIWVRVESAESQIRLSSSGEAKVSLGIKSYNANDGTIIIFYKDLLNLGISEGRRGIGNFVKASLKLIADEDKRISILGVTPEETEYFLARLTRLMVSGKYKQQHLMMLLSQDVISNISPKHKKSEYCEADETIHPELLKERLKRSARYDYPEENRPRDFLKNAARIIEAEPERIDAVLTPVYKVMPPRKEAGGSVVKSRHLSRAESKEKVLREEAIKKARRGFISCGLPEDLVKMLGSKDVSHISRAVTVFANDPYLTARNTFNLLSEISHASEAMPSISATYIKSILPQIREVCKKFMDEVSPNESSPEVRDNARFSTSGASLEYGADASTNRAIDTTDEVALKKILKLVFKSARELSSLFDLESAVKTDRGAIKSRILEIADELVVYKTGLGSIEFTGEFRDFARQILEKREERLTDIEEIRSEADENILTAVTSLKAGNASAADNSLIAAISRLKLIWAVTEEVRISHVGGGYPYRIEIERVNNNKNTRVLIRRFKHVKVEDEFTKTPGVWPYNSIRQASSSMALEADDLLREYQWLKGFRHKDFKTRGVVEILDKMQEHILAAQAALSPEERAKFVQPRLEDEAKEMMIKEISGILFRLDRVEVYEKEFAKICLEGIKTDLEYGRTNRAFVWIGFGRDYFDLRAQAIEGMFVNIKRGRRAGLKNEIGRQSANIIDGPKKTAGAEGALRNLSGTITSQKLEYAENCIRGIFKEPIIYEPEYEYLHDSLYWAIDAIKSGDSKKIKIAGEILEGSRAFANNMDLVYKFKDELRAEYEKKCLEEGYPAGMISGLFFKKFKEYEKRYPRIEESDRLWWMLLYRALYIPLNIRVKATVRGRSVWQMRPNPAFAAMTFLIEMERRRDLGTVLDFLETPQRQERFKFTLDRIRGFKDAGKKSIDSLGYDERLEILSSLSQDMFLDPRSMTAVYEAYVPENKVFKKRVIREASNVIANNLPREDIFNAAKTVTDKILAHPRMHLEDGKFILCYLSFDNEIMTWINPKSPLAKVKYDQICLIESLLKAGKRVALPVPHHDGTMALYEVTLQDLWTDNFERGEFGVYAPKKKPVLVDKKDIGVVIIPGRAFDLKGHRIGEGVGYYDRFFQSYRDEGLGIPYTIGVSYDFQLSMHELPATESDIPIDEVITPRGHSQTLSELKEKLYDKPEEVALDERVRYVKWLLKFAASTPKNAYEAKDVCDTGLKQIGELRLSHSYDEVYLKEKERQLNDLLARANRFLTSAHAVEAWNNSLPSGAARLSSSGSDRGSERNRGLFIGDEFFPGQLDVFEDFAHKASSQILAFVKWYYGGAAVRVPEVDVASFLANAFETEAIKYANNLSGFERGDSTHQLTSTSWSPTNSNGMSLGRSTSIQRWIASLILSSSVGNVFACVWQPFNAGQLATNTPSSSFSMITKNCLLRIQYLPYFYLILTIKDILDLPRSQVESPVLKRVGSTGDQHKPRLSASGQDAGKLAKELAGKDEGERREFIDRLIRLLWEGNGTHRENSARILAGLSKNPYFENLICETGGGKLIGLARLIALEEKHDFRVPDFMVLNDDCSDEYLRQVYESTEPGVYILRSNSKNEDSDTFLDILGKGVFRSDYFVKRKDSGIDGDIQAQRENEFRQFSFIYKGILRNLKATMEKNSSRLQGELLQDRMFVILQRVPGKVHEIECEVDWYKGKQIYPFYFSSLSGVTKHHPFRADFIHSILNCGLNTRTVRGRYTWEAVSDTLNKTSIVTDESKKARLREMNVDALLLSENRVISDIKIDYYEMEDSLEYVLDENKVLALQEKLLDIMRDLEEEYGNCELEWSSDDGRLSLYQCTPSYVHIKRQGSPIKINNIDHERLIAHTESGFGHNEFIGPIVWVKPYKGIDMFFGEDEWRWIDRHFPDGYILCCNMKTFLPQRKPNYGAGTFFDRCLDNVRGWINTEGSKVPLGAHFAEGLVRRNIPIISDPNVNVEKLTKHCTEKLDTSKIHLVFSEIYFSKDNFRIAVDGDSLKGQVYLATAPQLAYSIIGKAIQWDDTDIKEMEDMKFIKDRRRYSVEGGVLHMLTIGSGLTKPLDLNIKVYESDGLFMNNKIPGNGIVVRRENGEVAIVIRKTCVSWLDQQRFLNSKKQSNALKHELIVALALSGATNAESETALIHLMASGEETWAKEDIQDLRVIYEAAKIEKINIGQAIVLATEKAEPIRIAGEQTQTYPRGILGSNSELQTPSPKLKSRLSSSGTREIPNDPIRVEKIKVAYHSLGNLILDLNGIVSMADKASSEGYLRDLCKDVALEMGKALASFMSVAKDRGDATGNIEVATEAGKKILDSLSIDNIRLIMEKYELAYGLKNSQIYADRFEVLKLILADCLGVPLKERYGVKKLLDFAVSVVRGPLDDKFGPSYKKEYKGYADAAWNENEIFAAFLNLVWNARKSVKMKYEAEERNILIGTEVAGGEIVIKISDTGCGMSDDKVDAFNSPEIVSIESTSHEGLGQGLKIAKEMVRRNGGMISVESELGKGTTFTIRLPLTDRREPQTSAARFSPSGAGIELTADDFEKEITNIFALSDTIIHKGVIKTGNRSYPYTMTDRVWDGMGKPPYFRAGDIFVINAEAFYETSNAGKGNEFERVLTRYPKAVILAENGEHEGGWDSYTYHDDEIRRSYEEPLSIEERAAGLDFCASDIYYELPQVIGILISMQEFQNRIKGHVFIDVGSRNGLIANAALKLGAKKALLVENAVPDENWFISGGIMDKVGILPSEDNLITANLKLNNTQDKAALYQMNFSEVPEEFNVKDSVVAFNVPEFGIPYYDLHLPKELENINHGKYEALRIAGEHIERASLLRDITSKIDNFNLIIASGGTNNYSERLLEEADLLSLIPISTVNYHICDSIGSASRLDGGVMKNEQIVEPVDMPTFVFEKRMPEGVVDTRFTEPRLSPSGELSKGMGLLQQSYEVFGGNPRAFENGAQGSWFDALRPMQRNHGSSAQIRGMDKDGMTASLAPDNETGFLERPDYALAGNLWQGGCVQAFTSTSSNSTSDSGSVMLSSFSDSMYKPIASLALDMHSSIDSPWDAHPGSAGTYTEYPPSRSGSRITLKRRSIFPSFLNRPNYNAFTDTSQAILKRVESTGDQRKLRLSPSGMSELEKSDRIAIAVRAPWHDMANIMNEYIGGISTIVAVSCNWDKSKRNSLPISLRHLKKDEDKILSLIDELRLYHDKSVRGEDISTDYDDIIFNMKEILAVIKRMERNFSRNRSIIENSVLSGGCDAESISEAVDVLNEHHRGAYAPYRIWNSILGFAKKNAERKDTIDLKKLLKQEVFNELKRRYGSRTKKITIESMAGTRMNLKGNHALLRNMFLNVIDNAMEYSKAEKIIVTLEEKDGFVAVKISDDGIGIPPEFMEPGPNGRLKLFDLNVTGGEGTGLGMTEAWYAVKDHGGTIDVESELGKGTTFTIRLPIAKKDRFSASGMDKVAPENSIQRKAVMALRMMRALGIDRKTTVQIISVLEDAGLLWNEDYQYYGLAVSELLKKGISADKVTKEDVLKAYQGSISSYEQPAEEVDSRTFVAEVAAKEDEAPLAEEVFQEKKEKAAAIEITPEKTAIVDETAVLVKTAGEEVRAEIPEIIEEAKPLLPEPAQTAAFAAVGADEILARYKDNDAVTAGIVKFENEAMVLWDTFNKETKKALFLILTQQIIEESSEKGRIFNNDPLRCQVFVTAREMLNTEIRDLNNRRLGGLYENILSEMRRRKIGIIDALDYFRSEVGLPLLSELGVAEQAAFIKVNQGIEDWSRISLDAQKAMVDMLANQIGRQPDSEDFADVAVSEIGITLGGLYNHYYHLAKRLRYEGTAMDLLREKLEIAAVLREHVYSGARISKGRRISRPAEKETTLGDLVGFSNRQDIIERKLKDKKVSHPQEGEGVITKVERLGGQIYLIVQFDSGRRGKFGMSLVLKEGLIELVERKETKSEGSRQNAEGVGGSEVPEQSQIRLSSSGMDSSFVKDTSTQNEIARLAAKPLASLPLTLFGVARNDGAGERIHATNFQDMVTFIQAQTQAHPPSQSTSDRVDASADHGPLIIALGTSWIRGYERDEDGKSFRYLQGKDLNELIISMRNWCESKGVPFIVDDDDKLLARINAERAMESKANARVIVLAGENTVRSDDFAALRNDEKNAFVAGINNQELTVDSYIRLMEMLTLILKLSAGLEVSQDSTSITITKDDKLHLYILIPHAEPMDYDKLSPIYGVQIEKFA